MQPTRTFTVIITGGNDTVTDDLRIQVQQLAEGHARLEDVRIIVTKPEMLDEAAVA